MLAQYINASVSVCVYVTSQSSIKTADHHANTEHTIPDGLKSPRADKHGLAGMLLFLLLLVQKDLGRWWGVIDAEGNTTH